MERFTANRSENGRADTALSSFMKTTKPKTLKGIDAMLSSFRKQSAALTKTRKRLAESNAEILELQRGKEKLIE